MRNLHKNDSNNYQVAGDAVGGPHGSGGPRSDSGPENPQRPITSVALSL